MGWIPQRVYIKSEGTFKFLDVENPLNPGDSSSFALLKQKLNTSIRAISIKEASVHAVSAVFLKCLCSLGPRLSAKNWTRFSPVGYDVGPKS